MKTYLTIQASRGEGDNQVGRVNGREGKWEEEAIRSKHSWGGTGSKARIEEVRSRIEWREI